jgi:hypothetical protein
VFCRPTKAGNLSHSCVDTVFLAGLSALRFSPANASNSPERRLLRKCRCLRVVDSPPIGFAWTREGVTQMKLAMKFAVLAGLLVAGAGQSALAGYCGAASYSCCPTSACSPCGDYGAASSCSTCYKTVQDVVYDKCQVTKYRTVYDTVCEQQPITCTRNVYETKFRDECYSIQKPVYQVCFKDVPHTRSEDLLSQRAVHGTCSVQSNLLPQ